MAAPAKCLTTVTEQWIRDKLKLKHRSLGDVRSLALPGTYEEKIRHLGNALINFVCLRSLDLSFNALVSVKGVQHLGVLERLILYYNCIPSLEEVKELYQLPALRELDLRLNPLAKSHPNYRLHLVHTLPNLSKLDGYSVKDTECKAAVMQSSTSDLLPQQKSSSFSQAARQSHGRQSEAQALSVSVHKEEKEPDGDKSKDFTGQRSSTPIQQTVRSILRHPPTEYESGESRVTDRPKVTFSPYVEKNGSVPGIRERKPLQKQSTQPARGHFTPNPDQSHGHSSSFINIRPPSPRQPGLNLSDPSNPILHPPRLTHSSFNRTEGSHQGEKTKRGRYRKPLEMLLNLVDKHWTGEKSLHHNNNFLSQAVHILSMMEDEISSQEAEVMTLKREANALTFQLAARDEEHKTERCCVSVQLEEALSAAEKLNEQLSVVLEENVSLQKQLVKREQQYLNSMMKSSPIAQIKEAQMEVQELRREIEKLREKKNAAL